MVLVVIAVFVVPIPEVNLIHYLQEVEGYLRLDHQPGTLIVVILPQYLPILTIIYGNYPFSVTTELG